MSAGRRLLAALVLVALCAPVNALSFDPAIEAAQSALFARGFAPGPVDGLMGRRTRGAIRDFQRAEGLPVSGRLDPATRRALGLLAPSPPAAAAPVPATPAPAVVPPAAEPTAPSPPIAGAPETRPPAEGSPLAEEPPPVPSRQRRLVSYAQLGWVGPESGAAALARYRAAGRSPIMERAFGDLVVPSGEEVYVLEEGDRLPGLDCDPSASILFVEPLLGIGGSLMVTDVGDAGLCQLGFGVVLGEGRILYLAPASWGETALPGGRYRVGPGGLEYLGPR